MQTTTHTPLYAKLSLISVGLLATVTMLYLGQSIIVPIIYATILAIVLTPIVNFFTRKKMNRVLAISVTLFIVITLLALLIGLLATQASMFSASFPAFAAKFELFLHDTETWAAGRFRMDATRVHNWTNEATVEIEKAGKALIGQTLVNIGNVLVVLFLIPVYTFLILFYQPLLVEFIHELFSVKIHGEVNEILISTKKIIQSYLVGLLLEALIVAALNVTGLLILGIDYAILMGVVGALLNVIPYIGGIIAVALPMLIAMATKSPSSALLVLALYIFIQFIDNHFIIPRVVASKVQINALLSIVIVLAGGALWGVGGMFLSIPLAAVLKVIFDHVDGLKPWGYVLGNIIKKEPSTESK